MTLIDGDRIVTAQLYDDEHEEFTEQKMSIIDFVNAYTDEGVTTADDVLDKIRAEIEQLPTNTRINWDGCCPDIDYPEIEYVDVTKNGLLSIIDKYKAETEVKDGNND